MLKPCLLEIIDTQLPSDWKATILPVFEDLSLYEPIRHASTEPDPLIRDTAFWALAKFSAGM